FLPKIILCKQIIMLFSVMLDTVKVDLLLNPYVMTVKFKSLITSKFMSISEFKITYLAVDNSFLNSTLLLIFASIIIVSNFMFFTFRIFLSVINIIFSDGKTLDNLFFI